VGRRSSGGQRRPWRATRAASLALLLAACAGELAAPGEALRFLAPDVPEAIVNEPYRAPVHAVGGLRPYEFRLEGGALPPGIELVGGVLQGTPTEVGTYEFTLVVSDADLSSTFQEFVLRVVQPPPPALSFAPPDTEVRGSVTLRARLGAARALQGLSTLVTWDAGAFALVEDSVRPSRDDVALFTDVGPGRLQVDLAALGGTVSGEAELFRFELVPLAPPAVLRLTSITEFASRRGGGLVRETAELTEGGTPRPRQPAEPGEDEGLL
jgi:hypothetical protein